MMTLKNETIVRTFRLLVVCILFAADTTNVVIVAVNGENTNATITADEPDSKYFCNICGSPDNIMLDAKGIVTIDYNGEKLKNSCLNWQEIVQNPVAITEDFCRNRMLNYTINACKCATNNGFLLTDIKPDELENEESEKGTESTLKSGGKTTLNTVLVFWTSLVSFYIIVAITGYEVYDV